MAEINNLLKDDFNELYTKLNSVEASVLGVSNLLELLGKSTMHDENSSVHDVVCLISKNVNNSLMGDIIESRNKLNSINKKVLSLIDKPVKTRRTRSKANGTVEKKIVSNTETRKKREKKIADVKVTEVKVDIPDTKEAVAI